MNNNFKVIKLSKRFLILVVLSFLILGTAVMVIHLSSKPTKERPETDNVMGVPVT